jgi:hypothetical protein
VASAIMAIDTIMGVATVVMGAMGAMVIAAGVLGTTLASTVLALAWAGSVTAGVGVVVMAMADTATVATAAGAVLLINRVATTSRTDMAMDTAIPVMVMGDTVTDLATVTAGTAMIRTEPTPVYRRG